MISLFFIERPIFAAVISILIVIAGAVAVFTLPVAQYPDITPPMVQVTASYPGADPGVVADTVAASIEQEVNGVENMLYMSSTSASNGSYSLKITFELGTDPDMATVLVQNRVARALPRLPEAVQRQGVITKKSSTNFVNILGVYSPSGRFDDLYIANYVTIRIKDRLARLKGVGDLYILPEKDYGMRIWLDPNRLEFNKLTTTDVVNALKAQNVQVAAGQIGAEPVPQGQNFQLTINTLGRLSQVEQFENVIVKRGDRGRITRVKDVARVELGGKNYDTQSFVNGRPGATIVVFQAPGSNALDVADLVKKTMEDLKKDFPDGLDYKMVYDASDFVRASIHEVVKTLIEAFILVFIVVFIFLQDWRATLIPSITIPVSLIGTFSVMALLGFSVNMITLFGLVLAIGIVVDDAIVVVENVERNMTAFNLNAKDASIRAMKEITGAVVGITLVLMAVFVPAAFLGGITGQLYRQFSLTIAFTTLFSALNALTLSPALCALLLKPHSGPKNVFFRGFNSFFDRVTGSYTTVTALCVRRISVMMILFAALLGCAYLGFVRIPTGFLPAEDDGLVLVNAQLPDGASLERTRAVMEKVGEILKKTQGVKDYSVTPGWSLIDGTASNMGFAFAALAPWEERLKSGRSKEVILQELAKKFYPIQEADGLFPFSLPPISGLGQSGGFEMQLQDQVGMGLVALQEAADDIAFAAQSKKDLLAVGSTFRADGPVLFADVDRDKVMDLQIPLQSVFDTMQAYLGSEYVNDFNKFGRTWQLKVQADSRFRRKPDDITRLQVRTVDGKMVPLGAIMKIEETLGPQRVDRYNMYPSARVAGEPAPGFSSGQALKSMEDLAAAKLPKGIGYEWTGMAYQEKKAGGQVGLVFGLAVLVVLLILSAQYESWTDPIAVVLIVPLGVLGAVLGLMIRDMDNNLYTQVGLVLLVGLSAKNAILIVEFARDLKEQGKGVLEAAVESAKLRFRPIIMTSLAFIIGVVPLVLASGAGAASRQSLGTAVFSGMLGVTILGVFFAPVMYVLVQKLRRSEKD
jgi:hydrophobe/amphiphile efflux-1 (HAE1) family protein